MKKNFYITIIGYFFSQIGFCSELQESFLSVRSKGMGGASTAVANDSSAVWLNPAGIGRINKAKTQSSLRYFSFPNIVAGASKKANTYTSDVQDAKNNPDPNALASKSTYWGFAGINPIIYMNGSKNNPLAFGLVAMNRSKVSLDNSGLDKSQVDSIIDFGGLFNFGIQTKSKLLSIGFQIRPTYRIDYVSDMSLNTLGKPSSIPKAVYKGPDANKAFGIGADFGFLWTMADYWFPSLGLAVYNLPTGCQSTFVHPYTQETQSVCGTIFNGKVSNKDSANLLDPMDIRAGISIGPRFGQKVNTRFALDVHHYGYQQFGVPNVPIAKMLHGGFEIYFGNPSLLPIFALRAGMHQGFPSYGGTLRMGALVLEGAFYGQDVSSSISPEQDPRGLLSLSLEF